jgi:hypothetical protein
MTNKNNIPVFLGLEIWGLNLTYLNLEVEKILPLPSCNPLN